MNDRLQVVVPDCREPDRYHDPPGIQAAVYYYYEWHDPYSGLDLGWVLCVACCARIRLLAEQPQDDVFAPPPVRITVLRDANTLERVI